MPVNVVVSETEVQDVLDTASEAINDCITIYDDRTYEDGVVNTLKWMPAEGAAPPFEDGDVEAAYDAESDSDEDEDEDGDGDED